MAGLNVGTMSARLGLDPSEFLEKMKGVEGFNTGVQQRMAQQTMRSARQGAEAWRLIDEALGIHVSRPLTRIMTQEFPAFARILQSVLGGAAVGALAVVGVEAYEKLTKAIERARHAQEELRDAALKVKSVQENAADSWALKIASLHGQDVKIKIAMEGAGEARKQIDDLAKAEDELNKKTADAASISTRFFGGVGKIFTSESGDLAEKQQQKFKELKRTIDEAFRFDQLTGSHTGMQLIDADIKSINSELLRLKTIGADAGVITAEMAASAAGLERQKKFLQELNDQIVKAEQAWESAKKKADAHEAAVKASAKAVELLGKFYKEIEASGKHLLPETDTFTKAKAEVDELRDKAIADFMAISRSAASALDVGFAIARLNQYEFKLREVLRNAQLAAAEAALPANVGAAAGPMNLPSAPVAMPMLGGGGLPAAQLDTFAADKAAQLKLIGDAQAAQLPTLEKAAIAWAKLDIAFAGRSDADSVATKLAAQTAVIDQYGESMIKASDKAHKLQEEVEKLLERSKDAGDGFKAFIVQMQINDSDARSVFTALTTATKGAEDAAAHSVVAIVENYHRSHVKLMKELASMWESYFANLTQMALKRGMDKILSGLLSKIPGMSNAGQGAPLVAAGAALQTAAAALMAAAASLHASAAAKIPSGLFGNGLSIATTTDSVSSAAPVGAAGLTPLDMWAGFAEGGNAAPGSSFIAGEAGEAEAVQLGTDGGAHITPLGSKGTGAVHYHHNDFRGAVVTDDLLRKAEAGPMMAASETRAVARAVSMTHDIARRGGNQRG